MSSTYLAVFRSVCVVSVVLFATGWSAFCPVTSPNDEIVYVTDNAWRLFVGVTKTECAVKCAFDDCRSFNYNSTSMNCSLFNLEPTNYAVDLSMSTRAYQFRDNPLRGLWPTVDSGNCSFPFLFNNVAYCRCRHSVSFPNDSYCASERYTCRLTNGKPAFCNVSSEGQISNTPYFTIISSPPSGFKPRDCADIVQLGSIASGVYTVYVSSTQRPLSVYCDMTATCGGWTVFQRRQDGSVDFYRNWTEYANGFGNINGEFWLGNDNLFDLTSSGKQYELRIDLATFDGNVSYAAFSKFIVMSSADYYRLVSIGTYSGTAGDSMSKHVGRNFTTKDQDNDPWAGNCAVSYHGAWWYNSCLDSNLNADYMGGTHTERAIGVEWKSWTGLYYSLRFTEMKIRPINY